MRARAPFIWTSRQAIDPAGLLAVAMRVRRRDEAPNRWFLFRRVIDVSTVPSSAPTRVTADGRYLLYVNGTRVGRGPVRCSPLAQKYDVHDLAPYLRPGRNVVGALVHVFGADTSWYERVRGLWQPAFGDGALWLDGDVVRTDLGWRCVECPAWDRTTPAENHGLDFIESFDARLFPDAWLDPAFDDAAWDAVHVLETGGGGPESFFGGLTTRPFPILLPNPLPPLAERFVAPVRLVWTREAVADPSLPIERRAYDEQLGPVGHDGFARLDDGRWRVTARPGHASVALLDLGKLHTGYVSFALDAHGGEEIEVCVAEQLPGEFDPAGPARDARIARRPLLGHDAHVTRYRARPGRQRFERFSWQAVKWLQISVRDAVNGVVVEDLGVVQTSYPVRRSGSFACADDFLTRLWEVGAYTLELCAHDGWEDCPSREQRQWLGDATVEQLVGQVAFGPSIDALNAKYLRDVADSQRPDGLTQMFAPGNHGADGLLIPDWTLQWILNARNHLRWSGDLETVEAIFPAIERALAWFTVQLDAHDLVADLPYWHFMDWAGVGRAGEACTLNAQLAGCLVAAGEIASALERPRSARRYAQVAARIRAALVARHWDEARGVYVDVVDPATGAQQPRVSQHANAAMILWGGAPRDRWPRMIARITDPARVTFTAAPPIAPSGETLDEQEGVVLANTFYGHFVQCALIAAGRGDLVLDLVRRRYGPMLARGATTLWESFEPTASLCHGFSATPTYQLTTGILGLSPAADGFARLRVAPLVGLVDGIAATLDTVRGAITARLASDGDAWRLALAIPAGMEFEVHAPAGWRLADGPVEGTGGAHAWRFVAERT